MIDIRKLKELVRLMVANELTELDLRDSEEQVSLRRQPPSVPGEPAHVIASHPAGSVAPAAANPGAASNAAPGSPADESAEGGHRIESPMVGTFYSAPNPDAPAFIKVGDAVDAESVVCIVEAMKIFNEIKAGCTGTVQKVMVSNGESVEFGQPLFLVKPN